MQALYTAIFLRGAFIFQSCAAGVYPLPLTLGEVAERSEGGEDKQIGLIIQNRHFSHLAALGFAKKAAYRFSPLSHLR